MRKLSAGPPPRRLELRWLQRVGCWSVVALALTTRPAFAQSAADKATARQLATQGIQYYQQGKHADALDLLQRAEQLYDAPVHLIYIARTQAALGKVVDASETYRRLVRTDLPAGAPQAFKDAVTDAQKELQQLEPKIPSLRIDVVPADTKGLQLKVDGEVVSSVIVGINRPTNPGKHTVEAAAANYDTATASVDLAPGGKQTVKLQMHSSPGAPAPVGPTSAAAPAPKSIASTETKPAEEPPPSRASAKPAPAEPIPFDAPPHIVIGLRGVFATLGGKLGLGGTDSTSQVINGVATDAPLHDRMSTGGGFEMDLGFRMRIGSKFALMPKLAFQYLWLKAGSYYNKPIGDIIMNYSYGDSSSGSTVLAGVQPQATIFKVGAVFEFPRASSAFSPTYFAELMLIASSQLTLAGDITTGTHTCKMSDKYSGSGLGLGVGINLPVSRWFRLSPAINLSGVAPTHRDYSDTCPRSGGASGVQGSLDLSTTSAIYTIAEATLGGDFQIGL
jgi:hypothetical protein